MERKLGKLAPRHDVRTLRIESYMPELPDSPPAVDWSGVVTAWGMLLNDSQGDCTCAGAGHMIECWTSNAGSPVVVADATIETAYVAVTGIEGAAFNPATGANDNGCVELDVLNYWRQTGIAGHIIGAYASVHTQNVNHVKAAVDIFGGLYIGVALPASAQNQDVWDVATGPDSEAGSWGGHCVNVVGYDADGLTVVTWGATKRMTWAFWLAYVDEAYAILSSDFLNSTGQTPGGFDLAMLQADLKAVTS
jgi:hypothetical protein